MKRVRASEATGLTHAVAEFALRTEPTDLPAHVVDSTRRVLLDTIACAVAAFDTSPARPVIAHKRHLGGSPHASLVVDGDKLSCSAAAYVNTQLVNVMDADETLLNFGHFGPAVVMPALAVGEMTSATGAELIAAIALGFEVAGRVGLALPNYSVSERIVVGAPQRGFSWAAIGTAAATGRLLGLDSEQLANAFGIVMATTPVHGCLERFTTNMTQWHKGGMLGAIAEAGVNAALLSSEGFRTDTQVLDRDSPFFRSFGASGWEPDVLAENLASDEWLIAETSIKPYPFSRFAHGAIDSFERIVHAQDLHLIDIDEVTVTVPPFAFLQKIVDSPLPTNGMDVMISLPFAFAMIAERIAPGPAWWTETSHSAERLAFAGAVRSRINPDWEPMMTAQIELEGYFRRIPITVAVRSSGGETWQNMTEFAKGDPWGPAPMTDAELDAKVIEFTRRQLGFDGAGRLITAAAQLYQSSTVAPLVSAMVRGSSTV